MTKLSQKINLYKLHIPFGEGYDTLPIHPNTNKEDVYHDIVSPEFILNNRSMSFILFETKTIDTLNILVRFNNDDIKYNDHALSFKIYTGETDDSNKKIEKNSLLNVTWSEYTKYHTFFSSEFKYNKGNISIRSNLSGKGQREKTFDRKLLFHEYDKWSGDIIRNISSKDLTCMIPKEVLNKNKDLNIITSKDDARKYGIVFKPELTCSRKILYDQDQHGYLIDYIKDVIKLQEEIMKDACLNNKYYNIEEIDENQFNRRYKLYKMEKLLSGRNDL